VKTNHLSIIAGFGTVIVVAILGFVAGNYSRKSTLDHTWLQGFRDGQRAGLGIGVDARTNFFSLIWDGTNPVIIKRTQSPKGKEQTDRK
jgi:hypothetical protein